MKAVERRIYQFGDFALEVSEHRLRRSGQDFYLPPKTFETLLYLVERHGHLVKKNELLDTLWADAIVTENALTRCIKEVREALGDDAQHPRFIQTIPRVGYKFIAKVEEVAAAAEEEVVEEEYTAVRVKVSEEEHEFKEEKEGMREWKRRRMGEGKPAPSSPAPMFSVSQSATRSPSHSPTRSHRWRWNRNVLAIRLQSAPRTAIFAVSAALIVATAGVLFYRHQANLKWARNSISRVEELARAGRYFEAYDLAVGIRKYLLNEATIMRLMPMISDDLSVTTEPAGAQVYLRRFSPDGSGPVPPRQLVGTTPLTHRQIVRGDYILYIEKEGHANVERTLSGALLHDGPSLLIPPPLRVEMKLMEAAKIPERMVFVPGGEYRLVAWRRPTDARVRLDDYFIDQFEVTHQEYKEFISAGGYLKKQFWKYPFIKAGRTLSWEEAMREFKDRTGLPGPRNWLSQNYPEGQAHYPVTDLTWYEAAAYAAFRGKQLPTIFQWEKAARNGAASFTGLTMPW